MKINAVIRQDLDLQASADTRELEGLLLPFGEVGYTSVGPVTVTAGAVTMPAAAADIVLNLEHDARTLLGRATELTETPEGIRARFVIAKTRAGDDALEEVREGLRSCLSVEISDVQITAGKELTAGTLTGAGLVLQPAFASARLAAAAAEETEPEPDQEQEQAEEDQDEAADEAADEETGESREKEEAMPNARITNTAAPVLDAAKKATTVQDLVAAFMAAQGGGEMKAALSDIIPSNWAGYEQPEYLAELWNGRSYARRVIPRLGKKDLKARKIIGWRWTTRPEVGPYEGNKAEIPSNKIATEQVEYIAQRIAGGHDIDRIFVDFDSPEFWQAYFAAMTESYARLSDATALAALAEAATPVTMGANDGAAPVALVGILDGVLSVLNETDSIPDTAFVAPSLWRDLMLTKKDDQLAYLDAALGFEEGTLSQRSFAIIPESRLDPGSVLVTSKDAATVHEYGGGVPIRVQALDVARGGVDAAVFGYVAVNVHDAGGLAVVSTGEEPAA